MSKINKHLTSKPNPNVISMQKADPSFMASTTNESGKPTVVAQGSPIVPLNAPRIYAYTEPHYKDLVWEHGYEPREGVGRIKVGFTTRQDVNIRVVESLGVGKPTNEPYDLLLDEAAIASDGSYFMDHDVHKILTEKFKAYRFPNTEWFECTIEEVKAAVRELQTGESVSPERLNNFPMREEQEEAVTFTHDYFENNSIEKTGKAPHILWNAKMRFGKTFGTFQLANRGGYKRALVLTYKADTKPAWRADLESHQDFKDWVFIDASIFKNKTEQERKALEEYYHNLDKHILMFVTFQDALGTNKDGTPKEAHAFLRNETWDICILDEYHFGSHRDKAKDYFQGPAAIDEILEGDPTESKAFDDYGFDEETISLNIKRFLYLSGTPFRQLANGEFSEDQIFDYTYADEQTKKAKYAHMGDKSLYAELPQMCLMTYKMPEEIAHIATDEGLNEFDLNTFFKAKAVKDSFGVHLKNEEGRPMYVFEHEEYVQAWLNTIRGAFVPKNAQEVIDRENAPQPLADIRLVNALRHMVWFLPNIASVNAMEALLKKQTGIYSDYIPVVVAGSRGGSGADALDTVKDAITKDPFKTKTITLTCGKLTTGVSVKEWTAIFMLRSLSTPESYFQSAFRVQTPWVIHSKDGNNKTIVKEKCYVFDWAPTRALRQISDYSSRLSSTKKTSTEQQVEEFLNFFPVLCYDGYQMQQLEAGSLLEIVSTGTSHSMLARRWQSPHLVNVGLESLKNLMNNKELVAKLENIEGFRNLGKDLEGIVSKEERLNKVKKEKGEHTPAEKKEKDENAKVRKTIKEKLIKFLTRIPAFMYLTDEREATLEDIILNLEPELFRSVTGLETEDFSMLKDAGVFNAKAMDEAIWAFRRFEEGSLGYAGNAHLTEKVGGFETIISREDLDKYDGGF